MPSAMLGASGGASMCYVFFFFQAEDGIRDWSVTGVQTCALPISVMDGSAGGCVEQALRAHVLGRGGGRRARGDDRAVDDAGASPGLVLGGAEDRADRKSVV